MGLHWTEVVYAAVLGIGCVGLFYAGVVGLVMLIEAVRSIRLRGRENARERRIKAVEGRQGEMEPVGTRH
ncbi:MAG: hypothetical protein ISS54_07275 [Dehalococcoidia bacterium]|nr:hypothetical protein [Dehalococcoidia bacterium]